jgi:predicted MPP superfamily phosphohydrolase
MIDRRTFLKRVIQTGQVVLGGAALTTAYGFYEASQIRVRRETIPVPYLPEAFAGKSVAVLGDFHHGPLVGIDFIRRSATLVNSLNPDLIALVGDFAHKGDKTTQQLPPCLEVLSILKAPLGVFAVPGNHDMQREGMVYRDEIGRVPLTDLTNRHVRLSLDGADLWLAGVDDLYWGKPDQDRALAGIPAGSAVVMLCHNPDYAEDVPDPRVGLMLSGHLHGGQIYLPGLGASWLPSKYGHKYRSGLVRGPASRVFVTRGLGEAGIPIRLNVPPEINLLTLVRDAV